MDKWCNKCKTHKPLEEFNKQAASPNGRNAVCRECFKTYFKSAQQKRDDAIKGYTGPYSRVAKMLKKAPPNLDQSLHLALHKVNDELNKLNGAESLDKDDISKMKELINMLLNIRKNARPLQDKEETKEPVEAETSNDDLFT